MQAEPPYEDVRFGVLGPLEGWQGDRRLQLGGSVNERVLVMLLFEAGHMVPASRLIQAVWGHQPPATALQQIRKAVADLRRRISGGRTLIVTEPPGYRAAVPECQVDLGVFAARMRTARKAHEEGRIDAAVADLQAGLDLWRGPVLAGTGGPVIEAAAASWEERRIAATELVFDLRLGRGEAGELIGELRAAVAASPLRENVRGQLMLALHRSGRRGEAVEEYARLRSLLAEDLGIEPSPRLSTLHTAILRGSPELDGARHRAVPSAVVRPAPPRPPVPRVLPHGLGDFTGRDRETEQLVSAVSKDSGRPGPRVLVIDGMGGSGKTALAVRVAHLLAPAYPGGQLYLDLRGSTAGAEPLSTGEALGALLATLGEVPGEEPAAPEPLARVPRWRSATADQPFVLILDNVADAAQVRPLLPSCTGSLVLVTSRIRLAELDSTAWLTLDPFDEAEAVELLGRILGADRVAAERPAASELVRLCGNLPLAVRAAGARLRKRPHWPLGHLADRLRDGGRVLAELRCGDISVESTLRVSYEAIPPQHRADFRTLGHHAGPDLGIAAAAALLNTGKELAEASLELLLDMNLLQQHAFGRYSFHPLVRAFARTLPAPPDSP
ncbi:BTAD domain-containing putative transcriptional regulator [Streptomyces sp. NPDC047002]|uniref:AfsR/SARP family transcriptional regulator n=1 Tax=Streptomyces sp. NPDC047002 TaxID=3155475 RepID=UPI003456AEC3